MACLAGKQKKSKCCTDKLHNRHNIHFDTSVKVLGRYWLTEKSDGTKPLVQFLTTTGP